MNDVRLLVNFVSGIISLSLMIWSRRRYPSKTTRALFLIPVLFVFYYTLAYGITGMGYISDESLTSLVRPLTGTLLLLFGLISYSLVYVYKYFSHMKDRP